MRGTIVPGRVSIIFVTALGLAAPLLGGCAATARDLLQEHQCMREASNRPDAIQRKAECQQHMEAGRPSPSNALDS